VWAIAVGVLLVMGFALRVWLARRMRQQAVRGARLLEEGRCAEALEVFEALRGRGSLGPGAQYLVGIARLMLWQLEAAFVELQRAWNGAQWQPAMRDAVPAALALTCALLGRTSPAAQWLEYARPGAGDGYAGLARAVLACRAGDFASAAGLLEAPATAALTQMPGALREALQAWCRERTTGRRQAVDAVVLFGETGPDTLAKVWPELAAFVLGGQREG